MAGKLEGNAGARGQLGRGQQQPGPSERPPSCPPSAGPPRPTPGSQQGHPLQMAESAAGGQTHACPPAGRRAPPSRPALSASPRPRGQALGLDVITVFLRLGDRRVPRARSSLPKMSHLKLAVPAPSVQVLSVLRGHWDGGATISQRPRPASSPNRAAPGAGIGTCPGPRHTLAFRRGPAGPSPAFGPQDTPTNTHTFTASQSLQASA